MKMKKIDIFCKIIDNFGDIGVVLRLAKELYEYYKNRAKIRVFSDRQDIFLEIAGNIEKNGSRILKDGVEFFFYENGTEVTLEQDDNYRAEIVIEAFGCDIPDWYLERSYYESDIWLNLEYLSFESWTKDFHLKESPVGIGKIKKYFFMPGFYPENGGVIIDGSFIQKKNHKEQYRKKLVTDYFHGEKDIIVSLFSYENNFTNLLDEMNNSGKKIGLLAHGEKSIESIEKIAENNFYQNIEIVFVRMIPQEEYDLIVFGADIVFVRGEESFVRGLLSGNIVIWQAYLQEEYLHMEKVEAYLEFIKKFFINQKVFEKYYDLVYNYNWRVKNSFDNTFPKGSEFLLEEQIELDSTFERISQYIERECNLVLKMDKFFTNISK